MGAILTKDGGLAVQLINATGASSVFGTLVEAHPTLPGAVQLAQAGTYAALGVMHSVDQPDGAEVWVVVAGLAWCLLEDGTEAAAGNWVESSDNQAGRVDASQGPRRPPPGPTTSRRWGTA